VTFVARIQEVREIKGFNHKLDKNADIAHDNKDATVDTHVGQVRIRPTNSKLDANQVIEVQVTVICQV